MVVNRTTARDTFADAYGVHVKDAYELVKMAKKPEHNELGKLKITERVITYNNSDGNFYGESHGYYDMPLKGNVGLNGEKELLEGLKDKEGYYLFVYKGEESEYIDCFQFLSELSDYVKANYNRIDELEYFDVYYGKKEIINENQ